MAIDITGEFQPSDGAHGFDLYDPQDIKAGNVNVALQAVAGGAFKGGSHATAPVGEVVPQVKTTTGAPTHSASEGTLCWDSVDNLLYVNNNGGTGWSLVGTGAGDVSAAANIADNVIVRGDGGAKGIQGSGVTLSDANAVTGVASIDVTGNITVAGTVDGRDVAADGTTQDSHIAASNPHSGSQPLDATLTALAALDATTGIVTQTGADAFARGQLSSDVTTTGASLVATIANDAVTNAKAANMAQSTIKGRAAGAGTGDPTDLTAVQVKTILGLLTFRAVVSDAAPVNGTILLVPTPKTAVTITSIRHKTDSGSCTFNLEKRLPSTPRTAGTSVLSPDATADSTSTEETSFASAGVASTEILVLKEVTNSSAVNMDIIIEYTID